LELVKHRDERHLNNNKCICEFIKDGRCTYFGHILAVIFPARSEFTSIIEMLKKHIFFEDWSFIVGQSVYGSSRATTTSDQINSAQFEKRLVNNFFYKISFKSIFYCELLFCIFAEFVFSN
jgi:hypothetical protein